MRAGYLPLASLLLLMLLLLLLQGTHLTEAAAVIGSNVAAAVDKEVAPVGVVKADLLSLEQEIGGNPATALAASAAERGDRHARSFLFGVGAGAGVGPAWFGGGFGGYGGYGGYGWGYPGYGYYGSSPYYGYGGSGYYPGVFGYQKIIIG